MTHKKYVAFLFASAMVASGTYMRADDLAEMPVETVLDAFELPTEHELELFAEQFAPVLDALMQAEAEAQTKDEQVTESGTSRVAAALALTGLTAAAVVSGKYGKDVAAAVRSRYFEAPQVGSKKATFSPKKIVYVVGSLGLAGVCSVVLLGVAKRVARHRRQRARPFMLNNPAQRSFSQHIPVDDLFN